ncbi:hypothetical protein ANANG_G00063240, partial [Anguilla anguilla]
MSRRSPKTTQSRSPFIPSSDCISLSWSEAGWASGGCAIAFWVGAVQPTVDLIDCLDLNGVFLILTGRASCTMLCSKSFRNTIIHKIE